MIRAIYARNGSVTADTDISKIIAAVEQKPRIAWLDITAEKHELSNEEIALLSDTFKFHELSIEDCLFPQYQPKIEEFENYLFTAVHGVKTKEKDFTDMEGKFFELDILVGKDFIVTVHTDEIPQLDLMFEKAKLKPQVELKTVEHLLYTIFDCVFSTYGYLTDKLNDKINTIEDRLLENPTKEVINEIFTLKKMLLSLRKVIEPQQNVYAHFTRENSGFISRKSTAYFRDILSDYKQLNQALEVYSQIISSIMEVYVSAITLKLNEIIKFLTIIATIFLPALLITSYYGMNVLPFAEHRILGDENVWYFAVSSMVVLTAITYIYMKKKKWF